jgi:hypothetical protein
MLVYKDAEEEDEEMENEENKIRDDQIIDLEDVDQISDDGVEIDYDDEEEMIEFYGDPSMLGLVQFNAGA